MKIQQCVVLLAMLPALAIAQQTSDSARPQPGQLASTSSDASSKESKRLFGIVPNYRTSPSIQNYEPLTVKGKFQIARQDALDRGTFILAAAFAGEGQLTNANPSFGQGAAGYGRYLGTAYADYFIGDYMTEGVFPSLFHQDPRYFRKGTGSGLGRLGYAMGQIFITHSDTLKTQVNYSELVGNSVAVAISNSYYPDNRDASDAVSKLGTQLSVDMASNVLKEFFPDLQRKFSHKHNHNE